MDVGAVLHKSVAGGFWKLFLQTYANLRMMPTFLFSNPSKLCLLDHLGEITISDHFPMDIY